MWLCKIYEQFYPSKKFLFTNVTFEGFRQVYEHYISNYHKMVTDCMKKKIQIKEKPNTKIVNEDKGLISNFVEVQSTGKLQKVACHHLWDSSIVSVFKNDFVGNNQRQ